MQAHSSGMQPHQYCCEWERPGELDGPEVNATLEDMRHALEFIRLLQNATLDDSNLSPETLDQLQNPPEEVLAVDDPDLLLWLQIYIAVSNASEETYNAVRDAVVRRFPQVKALSLYKIKKAVGKLSGVVGHCIGFTGTFARFERCHRCGQARYFARQTFMTMLPGPQIQAIFRSEQGAEDLAWFYTTAKDIIIATPRGSPSLAKYFDLVSGQKLLECHDVVLMLYQNKKSDFVSISPDKRAIIPGPNHPQVLDSFLFPGFYHVSALMREGLPAFNAASRSRILSKLFLALGTADGPGMAMFNGSVGHHGTLGCRIMCGLVGRHKPGCPHYYPALLKPTGPPVPGCDHDDISLSSIPLPSVESYERNLKLLLSARNETQYKQLRKATGLCKPSIMSGLSRTLPVPLCFPIDLMHLTCLNIPDLFVSLWRGTIQGSVLSDPKTWDCAILADPDVWAAHGLHVERARCYLPGFFDRAPRNIAEKLNSGYKAVEFMTWFYNYAPAMLRRTLPEAYWLQLCKLVQGVILLYAEDILPQDLVESKRLLTGAIEDYELLYYARDPDRLHVVRPCIHLIWHGPDHVVVTGALISDTQLPIERLIGDLGSEIKQHSNPYANLSQRAFRRCQVNALKAMLPYLDRAQATANSLPRAAEDLGGGYVLLRAMDSCLRPVSRLEATLFFDYLSASDPLLCTGEDRDSFVWKTRRWARLRLPNGTVARSAWKEQQKPLSKLRLARCVKVRPCRLRHMHYYYLLSHIRYFCRIGKESHPVAVVSVFNTHDNALYERSLRTVELVEYRGDESLRLIDIRAIESVVGMIPDELPVGVDFALDFEHLHVGHKYFVVEKLGFDVRILQTDTGNDPEMDIDE
ncbi:hypothetical protein C2E23DRAFT_864672 [Lenzites betulinus]|nr:hypothetical protein C2E23DRAFT_864672 [Lenzites betulinus]